VRHNQWPCSHSGVANAGDVAKECATTDGRVARTFGVVEKRGHSSARIGAAGRVVVNLEQMDSDCIFMVIENRSSGSPFYLDQNSGCGRRVA